jgi:DNA-binding HxlR family transcriptional regulator
MTVVAEELCGPRDAYRRDCPCRDLLDLIANRWSALTIDHLSAGSARFGELRRRLDGISQKVLTQTLRALERDGLVVRTVRPQPLEVHYALTELGRSAAEPLHAMREWSEANVDAMLRARADYAARQQATDE